MGKRFRKSYMAIVAPGAPEPKGGMIDSPLRRESIGREAYMRVCAPDHPDAETARSRYRTLSANAIAAWSSCRRTPVACTSCGSTWPRSAGRSRATAAMAGR
jgi:23S rRNA-/tRNA-specific pseudouridylate synthase